MEKILILKSYLQEKVWGSNNLKNYGIKIKNNQKIGEAWVVSGYENKSSIITNGKYKTVSLQELYKNHRELFNNYSSKQYPLLVKILDCNEKLSVQVHPDNKQASKLNSLGKNECWYILKAKKNANLVYGHNAKTKAEFKQLVENKQWSKLLKNKLVKKDDLIYVPSKTIHAIGDGIVLYELQQSSDITYRLYDYDRLENNVSRQLHIKESLSTIDAPFIDNSKTIANAHDNYLVDNNYFCLQKIENKLTKAYDYNNQAYWLQLTVISGSGKIDNKKVEKGFTCLIVNNLSFNLTGNLKILISFIKK